MKVRTEPLYPDYLAASRIDISDPWQPYFFGTQIVAKYRFSKLCLGEKYLTLTIRYCNKEWDKLVFPLDLNSGYFIYRLVGDDYWQKGGILAYKVELFDGDVVVNTWKHHLFVDLIEINP